MVMIALLKIKESDITMKVINIISVSLLFCSAIPLTSYALTFDARGGYRSGSHAYETRLKVSNGWENGWWGSLETDSWNGVHNNANEIIGLNYNELETNYTIHLTDKWSLKPGLLTHWSKSGTRFGPYLKLSYDVNPALNLGFRYRYDYNVYRSTDLDGNNSRANQHRWDGYVTYHINDLWTAAWQTTVYTYENNFRYNNHKKWATENAFVLQYQMTKNIAPYIEYDYLDKQGAYNGRDNLNENSYRVGVTFTL